MVKFVSYLKLNFNNQLNLSVITFSANLSQMKVFMPLHVWSNEDMPFT